MVRLLELPLLKKHTHDLAIDHRLQNRPPPQEVCNPDIYLVCGKFEQQQRLTSLSFISLSLIFFFPPQDSSTSITTYAIHGLRRSNPT